MTHHPAPFRPANDVAALFLGALLLGAAGSAAAQTSPPAPATADEGQLERITITAEKRLSLLDTTPAAVTALSGGKLADQGLTGFADVTTLVPNTSFTTGQGAAQLFIRGIGNVFILAGGDPGVALYADGAYVSDQTSSNVALFDLQRVEVLRGPQGALYGRNATGGAMNLISAAPTSTFQARAGVLFGDHGRLESEGFISGPLFGEGSTRLRLSYQVKGYDGYTRNPLAGTSSGPVLPGGKPTTGPKALDDMDSQAFRLQSATDVGDGQLRLIAGHYREKDAGPSMPVLVDPVMFSGLLFGVLPSTDPRVVKSQGSSNLVEVNSLLAGWEQPLGWATLSASASVRHSRADRAWDSDVTESLTASSGFATKSDDTSLDIHLSSDDNGPFTWLVGATHLQFDQTQDIDISTQLPSVLFGFPPPLFPVGVQFALGGTVKTRSSAVYTDLRYALSPSLSVLAGLRFNSDEKRSIEHQAISPLAPPVTGYALKDSWDSTPGSLGVEYKIDKSSLVYARYAHGFKSGAVNLGSLQARMVKPESADSIELGYKTDFWARRGTFSGALFSTRYKDMQVSQVGLTTVELTNASQARIDGAEIELQLRPLPPLTLGLALGLMDPTYTDFVNVDLRNAPTAPVNVKGNQLAQVSKANAAVNAEYSANLGSYKATLRADYVWRDKVYFTEFNTPDAVQGAYGLVNLSASLRPAQGGWKLYGFVKNAADTTAITSMSIASPLLGAARQVTYTPPRQFGVGASIDF